MLRRERMEEKEKRGEGRYKEDGRKHEEEESTIRQKNKQTTTEAYKEKERTGRRGMRGLGE